MQYAGRWESGGGDVGFISLSHWVARAGRRSIRFVLGVSVGYCILSSSAGCSVRHLAGSVPSKTLRKVLHSLASQPRLRDVRALSKGTHKQQTRR